MKKSAGFPFPPPYWPPEGSKLAVKEFIKENVQIVIMPLIKEVMQNMNLKPFHTPYFRRLLLVIIQ